MKLTIKQRLVRSYLEDSQYDETPTKTLARIIMHDNPGMWDSLNACRSYVLTARGEADSRMKPLTDKRRTKEQKEEARRNKAIPETDYVVNEPFIMPEMSNKVLILSDIHLPYHDPQALEIALKWGEKRGVNAIYLNGDTIDMYQASRFIRDPRLRQLGGELDMTRDFLDHLKERFNVPVYFKIGNHEVRWENYLKAKAPELFGIPEFRLDVVLRFGELGVILVKDKQLARFGKLAVMHGHEFGHSVFSPVNPARGLYLRAKESSIIGHHHQTSEHSEKQLDGSVTTTWSTGALCGLQPDYYPFNKWNHGFAFVEFDKSGEYEVENKRIIQGKVR